MRFNQHSTLSGRHAFLSPSSYHWLNYDYQKLENRYYAAQAARRGTDLHELAHAAISLRVPLDSSNQALSTYVLDAIDLEMSCEQPLFFSDNCFGTADTISFYDGVLRIHDLKTGITPSSPKQLEVYAAIFCLEYDIDPYSIQIELRIYQRAEVLVFEPPPEVIETIMGKIVDFDARVESFKGR